MLSIFLSHSHEDKTFARLLYERLMGRGIMVWIDDAEMKVGDSLIKKLAEGIRNSTYLGVILSPRSVSSPWVQQELNIALTEEIRGCRVKVLPLLIQHCKMPEFLNDKIYADFTESFESGFEVLIRRLEEDLQNERFRKSRAYEFLLAGYQNWVSNSRRDDLLLPPPNVNQVLAYAPAHSPSVDMLEFLCASISVAHTESLTTQQLECLARWMKPECENLLGRILKHPNPKIRVGTLELFGRLGFSEASGLILQALPQESDLGVRRAALRTARLLKAALPSALASRLLESDEDWYIQSFALDSLGVRDACLLVSDGTDFAGQIGLRAKAAGFQVVTLRTSVIASGLALLDEHLLSPYSLVALVRGEHFSSFGNDGFYRLLRGFVARGGSLLATSWVSWETRSYAEFVEVLPFVHVMESCNENVDVVCRPTKESVAADLLWGETALRTSYEVLRRKPGATVLLETEDSIPILGYQSFGSGKCYYLNTCQHDCLGYMVSPMHSSRQLHDAVGILMNIIRQTPVPAR